MPYSNPDARKAYSKKYYEKHKERLNELDRARYANRSQAWNKHLINETPEHREERLSKMRDYSLLKYGVTKDKYDQMLLEQGGKCAICLLPPKAKAGRHKRVARLAVDHCHKSGKVRKLLCTTCNLRLGWYERFSNEISFYLKEN